MGYKYVGFENTDFDFKILKPKFSEPDFRHTDFLHSICLSICVQIKSFSNQLKSYD